MTNTILDIAESLARTAHAGQTRKNGSPYIFHVEFVVEQVAGDKDAEVVAWLHDVLEDSDLTSIELRDAGIPKDLISAVELLTKRRENTYGEYIEIVKKSELAVKVKKADIIANLVDKPGNKQITKFSKALISLCSG